MGKNEVFTKVDKDPSFKSGKFYIGGRKGRTQEKILFSGHVTQVNTK